MWTWKLRNRQAGVGGKLIKNEAGAKVKGGR